MEEAKILQLILEAQGKPVPAFLSALSTASLPSFSKDYFEERLSYHQEAKRLLSRLSLLFRHPRLSLKSQEEILRPDQVSEIEPEDFLETMRRPSLWKRMPNSELKPGSLVHYENEDSLLLLENRFLITLLHLLEGEGKKDSQLLSSLLPDQGGHLFFEGSTASSLFLLLNEERKKVESLKKTRFYSVLKIHPLAQKDIVPTQILLKDPNYVPCYRFYRHWFKRPVERELSFEDLSLLLLLSLGKNGYSLEEKTVEPPLLKTGSLNGKRGTLPFVLSFLQEEKKIELTIQVDGKKEGQVLTLDSNEAGKKRTSVLGPFFLIRPDGEKKAGLVEDLVDSWVKSRFVLLPSNPLLYSEVCPHCGSRRLTKTGRRRKCLGCDEEYLLEKDGSVLELEEGKKRE